MMPSKVYICHACSSRDVRLIDGEPADWFEPYLETHEIRPAYVVCTAWPKCGATAEPKVGTEAPPTAESSQPDNQ